MKILLVIAMSLPLIAFAANPRPVNGLLAMGPDPGGHTGATVTPETTKTDRPAVDTARQSSSGSKTESNEPASGSPQAQKK